MHRTIPNPPNLITLLRFVLVPVTAVQIVEGRDAVAFCLLLIALASDAADGFVARRWNMQTAFGGAAADPLADKATLLTVVVLLAWQGALPWWFALAAGQAKEVEEAKPCAVHRVRSAMERLLSALGVRRRRTSLTLARQAAPGGGGPATSRSNARATACTSPR
jgi:hypothetical protein